MRRPYPLRSVGTQQKFTPCHRRERLDWESGNSIKSAHNRALNGRFQGHFRAFSVPISVPSRITLAQSILRRDRSVIGVLTPLSRALGVAPRSLKHWYPVSKGYQTRNWVLRPSNPSPSNPKPGRYCLFCTNQYLHAE